MDFQFAFVQGLMILFGYVASKKPANPSDGIYIAEIPVTVYGMPLVSGVNSQVGCLMGLDGISCQGI